jgi:hypothetical protein
MASVINEIVGYARMLGRTCAAERNVSGGLPGVAMGRVGWSRIGRD